MTTLRFGSLFAGIGGFDCGFTDAGLEPAWMVEIDPHCRRVLERGFPGVPLHRDIRRFHPKKAGRVDVICGGWPCQDLSVSGKRAGLAGARSGLFHQMLRVIHEFKPALVVWENVPGLFSSRGGRDFLTVLSALDGLGYSGAWTIADAKHFGLAQRRRRIFGVFARGDSGARRAAEILALRPRLCGNPPPRRQARPDVAATLGGGSAGGGRRDNPDSSGAFVTAGCGAGEGGPDVKDAQNGRLVTGWHENIGGHLRGSDKARALRSGASRSYQFVGPPQIAGCLQERDSKGPDSDTKEGHPIVSAPIDSAPYADRAAEESRLVTGTLRCGGREQGAGSSYDNTPIVFQQNSRSEVRDMGPQSGAVTSGPGAQCQNYVHLPVDYTNGLVGDNVSGTIEAAQAKVNRGHGVLGHAGVRRLTPRECERLQGFPDDWSRFGSDGVEMSDTHRYRMLGNAVAVPVARWLGRRIMEAEGR